MAPQASALTEEWADPLFDALAFAQALRPAVARAGTMREVAVQAGVSYPTVSRACQGWPQLSHENYLRLSEWLARAPLTVQPKTGDDR